MVPRDNSDTTLSSLASHMHVHDRCISEPRLRLALDRSPLFSPTGSARSASSEDADMDTEDNDADMLLTPRTPPDNHAYLLQVPAPGEGQGHPQKKRRKKIGRAHV